MTLSLSLTHAFPGFTLDVAFDAPEGVTALFGRSGSGKTTIVKALAGLLRPDQGRASIDDTLLFDISPTGKAQWTPPHQRRLGYVFQDGRLFPHLSVAKNLTYASRFLAQPPDAAEITRITDLLELGPLLNRRPATLSGGEQQRVAIGRALLARPRLLLLDEPLAALDDDRKSAILPFLERLRDEAGVPMLYVSHSMAEVARLATTIVALNAGRVTRMGPAAEMLADPGALPVLGVREAGALLTGTIHSHHDDGLTEVAISAGSLLLPRVQAPVGAHLRVRIEAQDVILSRSRPEGLSALNILPAVVTQLHHGAGPGAAVQLKAGDDLLLARITRRSANALDLQAGTACFAIIKSVAVAQGNVGRSA